MQRKLWLCGYALAASLVIPASSYAGDNPGLSLAKTAGVDSTECAAAQQIVVEKGTTVYYCYRATNTGDVTLNMHSLDDSELGWISVPNTLLPPGGVITATANAVINVTTRNVATWRAVVTNTDTYSGTVAPQVVSVTATNTALVSIASTAAPALSDAGLALVGAALLAFGAFRLSRKLRDPA